MPLYINNKLITLGYINNKSVTRCLINNKEAFYVDKVALAAELTTSNAIGTTNLRWTATTWTTFTTARTNATTVYNDIASSQAQVDSAKTVLTAARVALALQAISLSYTGSWGGQQTQSARQGYAVIYGSGTLTLNAQSNHFEVWAIGGGGGGGGVTGQGNYRTGGGGGGGGRVALVKDKTANAGTAAIAIGGGGAAGHGDTSWYNIWGAGTGGTSSFSGLGISVSASGGTGGTHSQVNASGYGGAGGSGGGGGSTNAYGGLGGQNGGTGGTGNAGGATGGAGAGQSTYIFQDNGTWLSSSPYGPGGIGGPFEASNRSTNASQAGANAWSGATGIRDGCANTGAGGGGGCIFDTNNYGSNGGSGLVVVRWYD
jgi:hypothetical protein